MNAQAITPIVFEDAERHQESLIIAIAGPSGAGKTRSALELARGLADGDDEAIGFIDTESGRARHYAPTRAEKASGRIPPDKFGFKHTELHAPFTPDRYRDAVAAANEAGFKVIIVDSASHEWNGEGGLQDWHDVIVEQTVEAARRRAASNNWQFDADKEADKASIGAWKDPKMAHKRFITRMLQSRAHLIFCLRAEEKLLMRTVEKKKANGGGTYKATEIIAPADRPLKERWVPICEKGFMYEMTVSLIVTPDAPGVPVPVKLEGQHAAAFPEGQQISAAAGSFLADWARGGDEPRVAHPRASPDRRALSAPSPMSLADRAKHTIGLIKERANLQALMTLWDNARIKALRDEAEDKDPDGVFADLVSAYEARKAELNLQAPF